MGSVEIDAEQANPSRRRFLGRAAAATVFSVVPRHVLGGPGNVAPGDRVTLAGIGMGGQGIQNMATFQGFDDVQVVAVCDVNRESGRYLSWLWTQGKEQKVAGREPARRMIEKNYAKQKASGIYQGCRAYNDFRELLGKEDIDAVMVATPDHTHAVITMAALKKRKHVYCEKPLTWSVHEARVIAEEARRAGVATQLGNQGQVTEVDRVVREMIKDGAIGAVREVKVAIGPRFWHYPAMQGRPTEKPPVPDGLDWDLWLGPAHERPYHSEYHPWTWRNWWDFGTGQLGDLGCHKLSTVFKALDLKHPTTVEASSTKMFSEVYPLGVIARYEFPARGSMPPVKLTWYDGGLSPELPPELKPRKRGYETIYVGEKGTIYGHRIVPESKMKAYGRPPKTISRSPGHYREFVDACRGGPPSGANFADHAGILTETCLLGNVALRAGVKLTWDGPNMRFTGNEDANRFLRRDYRKGWEVG